METKHQVHNLIILDESGSMQSIKNTIITGFNEIVETVKGVEKQFPEQEHFISFLTFNGLGQNFLLYKEPVSKLELIDGEKYQPAASTPLYDAMGYGFAKLRQDILNTPNCDVLVTILTDGEENASKEYTSVAIKALVDELKGKRWTFTYIGADHDVQKFATTISITNTITFSKNEADMKRLFDKEKSARMSYSKKIRNNEDTNSDFYDEKS